MYNDKNSKLGDGGSVLGDIDNALSGKMGDVNNFSSGKMKNTESNEANRNR